MVRRSKFPISTAVDYLRKALKQNKEMYKITDELVTDILKNDVIKQDTFLNINAILNKLKGYEKSVADLFGKKIITLFAKPAIEKVTKKGKEKVKEEVVKILKHDLKRTNVQLNAVMKASLESNIAYIKTIPEQYRQKLLEIFTKGRSKEEIIEEIKRLKQVTDNRTKLIVNDQLGKLFAQVVQEEHECRGLQTFRWRTMRDEKVRKSHQPLDGRIGTWKSGVDGKFPGTEVNCRCEAEVNEEELGGE